MGLGPKRFLSICALATLGCSEPQARYAAYGPGVLANNTTVSEVLCDTARINAILEENSLLKTAFTTVREPYAIEVDSLKPLTHALVDNLLGTIVSEVDVERVQQTYAWDTTSVIHQFGKLLSLQPPKYTLSINGKEIFDYVLSLTPTKNDSIPAAALVLAGFPKALTNVHFENDTIVSSIFINPFFVDEALTVFRHEQIHVWQFTPNSPLNMSSHPHDDYFVEGVATYLDIRLRTSFLSNPRLDIRIRDNFAKSTIRQVRAGDDPGLIVKYHLLPALIAHDAITHGPVQAISRVKEIPSCARP